MKTQWQIGIHIKTVLAAVLPSLLLLLRFVSTAELITVCMILNVSDTDAHAGMVQAAESSLSSQSNAIAT